MKQQFARVWTQAWSLLIVFTLLGVPAFFETDWAEAKEKAPEYAKERVIIKFRKHVKESAKHAFLAKIKAQSLNKLAFIEADLVKVPKDRSVDSWVKVIKSSPLVSYASPDYILTTDAKKKKKKRKKRKRTSANNTLPPENPSTNPDLPNDPYMGSLWGLHNTGQNGGKAGADINADEAWKNYSPAATITVAVIDSGIDYSHADLAANIWINSGEDLDKNGIITDKDKNNRDDDRNGYVDDFRGWDFVNGDNNPADDNSHGTHVAGTIAAVSNNRYGVAGVAGQGQVKVMALKFLSGEGWGYTSDAIEALGYAANKGVKIANNSWGGGSYSPALYDAIRRYNRMDGLFVAAAGNSRSNNDSRPAYPATYNLPNIISVASTTNTDALSSFSNYGKGTVHLGAPGSNILSTLPGNHFGSYSGTSMATPHVSGAAALLLSETPSLTPSMLKTTLLGSVRPNDALKNVTITGGNLDAGKALNGEDSSP